MQDMLRPLDRDELGQDHGDDLMRMFMLHLVDVLQQRLHDRTIG
jgi:hypothetical protein